MKKLKVGDTVFVKGRVTEHLQENYADVKIQDGVGGFPLATVTCHRLSIFNDLPNLNDLAKAVEKELMSHFARQDMSSISAYAKWFIRNWKG